MTRNEQCLYLIQALQQEMPQYADIPIPALPQKRWSLLRSLMNVRPPLPADDAFLSVQNAYLQALTREKGVTDALRLPPSPIDPRLRLWQGDITTLRCDTIVNAANSQLLGCFSPCHGCIDNIIHTMSGVQLRLACDQLMRAQGHEEPTGQAKITPGYNLPCKYILHTVGPIVDGPLTHEHERLLASCYRSCLELAEENGCQSIAFCCISTGVFMFPNQRAAEIAVKTVQAYYAETGSEINTVFNVFKDIDLRIYQQLLSPAR
ncbi:MAG: protein-ADP-ribose hydrolase [Clostridia bacterium]|nr:protein-ADP-ribose hydrolase [Clostridia bacterium]